MERLTEYVTENCSKPFYRFRSDGEIDIRYRYCINIEKAIDKLAEYENFMEENGFESLEDIKQRIKNMEYYEGRYKWQCKNSRINYEEFLNLQQENDQLKQQLKNMESDHELLINDFEEETKRLQKEIKHESDARKRFVIEVAKLKQQLAEKDKLLEKENKALEIACKKIEDLRFENADICDYEYNEIKTEIRIKLLLEEAEEALKKLNKE